MSLRRTAERGTTLSINSTHRVSVVVSANVVLNLLNLLTLMKEAMSSSETSVLARVRGRNIPEDIFIVTAVKTSNNA
jgi:hypothetical protein